ncbi:UNVERIFIED_CONTAM: hypothetical protein K2H54_014128 [Gekko kuhli]
MTWAEVWRRRAALLYTASAWVVFSYVAYYAYKYPAKREEEEPPPPGTSISEDGLRETLAYSTEARRFNVVSTTIYKPNFVPRTTRLHNYVQSILDDSGDKGK